MNYAEIIQKLDADGAKRLLTQLAENHALVAELVEEYGPQCVAEGIPTWEDIANEVTFDFLKRHFPSQLFLRAMGRIRSYARR